MFVLYFRDKDTSVDELGTCNGGVHAHSKTGNGTESKAISLESQKIPLMIESQKILFLCIKFIDASPSVYNVVHT